MTGQPRWDHATLDELVRRRNAFVDSWHEVIEGMRAETADHTEPETAEEEQP